MGYEDFELKPEVIQLLPNFHDFTSENPHVDIKEFEEVYANLHDLDVCDETVMIKLFSFSLKYKAQT